MAQKQRSQRQQSSGKSIFDQLSGNGGALLSIIIVTLCIYSQDLSFTIGKFDEDVIITFNEKILKDRSNVIEVLKRDAFFNNPGRNFYRPVQNLSFFIDWHLGKGKGWAFYLTNILIHAATCWLLFRTLKDFGFSPGASWASTILYASSPLFVHAIAWAPGRGDLLIAMFALICLRLTFRYLDTRKTSTLLALHVCFFLSMFSKETSALIPLMIVGAWWLFYPRRSETGKTILTCLLPCVIPIGLFFVARSIVIPKFPAPSVFGIGPFLNNLRVIPETIGKFFIPVGLAPLPEFTTLVTILGLGVATLLIVASLWRSSSNQRRLVLFGFGWFLLFTIPGTAYTNELGTIAYDYLEHRSYLPMIGIAFVLATILSKAFEGGRRESALMVVSGLAVLFAVLSYIHAQNYKNAELFYDMAIDGNPNSGMSLLNRGYLRAMKNDVNGAMRDYTQATIVTPTYAEAFVNRGVLYQNMNRMQDAGNDFKKAVELNPKLFAATYNLANWYGRHDDIRKALRWYQQSMELKPTHAEGWAMIGSIKAKLGDINGALPNFERALSVNPNLTIAFVNRGKALYNVGRTSEACADWSRGAALGDSEAASLQKSLCK